MIIGGRKQRVSGSVDLLYKYKFVSMNRNQFTVTLSYKQLSVKIVTYLPQQCSCEAAARRAYRGPDLHTAEPDLHTQGMDPSTWGTDLQTWGLSLHTQGPDLHSQEPDPYAWGQRRSRCAWRGPGSRAPAWPSLHPSTCSQATASTQANSHGQR